MLAFCGDSLRRCSRLTGTIVGRDGLLHWNARTVCYWSSAVPDDIRRLCRIGARDNAREHP
ncbi:hypothetical protein COCMIDRAFT_83874 [Bipolaris oryzae ATCC 44560]|uniref:Uncharacterized protein n=1 Tax=Bipolaris oryzae ATCC 44560 TaxID=930090 RepID=W6ZD34_COCMI|nr:uncharacterized protein COCMIDRAFT_83874 [Bipolaris oryzae ATCC 44560]EUC49687.1 hypothetical protein COCMIDRAFT_83874 [Bipolaris oryzae ATCC 44560]